MKILVTGSSGHLGEALVRKLRDRGDEVISIDLIDSPFTTHPGSIADKDHVASCMQGVETVFHTATLHKPHVATHSRQAFVDTNITGTLNLLEEAKSAGVSAFIFTSTTSTFGYASRPIAGSPASWITEEVVPRPRNIYGVTKLAAENLCLLFHQRFKMKCLILRTSRFFPEEDDNKATRERYEDHNAKINEFLYRRVDVEDAVSAHFLAAEKAQEIGYGCYIISATTPFTREDLPQLRRDAPAVLDRYFDYETEYARRGWRMFPTIDRVYVNQHARSELGWRPKYDFSYLLDQLKNNQSHISPLARLIGAKGYHPQSFEEGPYPVD